MGAPVRIEDEAFADVRIEMLGTLAGYNRFEALGRLAYLWRMCTQRGAYVVTEAFVSAALGDRGVEALLGAELGERTEGGIRVRGTQGRIEWLEKKRAQSKAGGKANASRHQAETEPNGSHPAPMNPDSAPIIEPTPSPLPLTPSITPQIPDVCAARARDPVVGTVAPDRYAKAQLVTHALDELNRIRSELAAEFGWVDVKPVHRMGILERELTARLTESGPEAATNLRHVLAIAEADAREAKSVEFLTGAIFDEKPWRRKLGKRLADTKRPEARDGALSDIASIRRQLIEAGET